MLRTGKPYLRDSDDEKTITHAAGGAPRPLGPAAKRTAEGLDGNLMESVRALISEQFQALRAELRQTAPPPQQACIRPSTRITRARKAKAAYDAMRKRRRRQSIAFARIMGQCDDDFAPPPVSKRPIAFVISPRRAAIAKFDARLGTPPASKIVGDDLAEPLSAPDDSQPTRDGEPSQLCNHPGKPLLPANPGEEASRFCDAIFGFLVQSMSVT